MQNDSDESQQKVLTQMNEMFPSFINLVTYAKYLTDQQGNNPESPQDVRTSLMNIFNFVATTPLKKLMPLTSNILTSLKDELNELIEVNRALRDEYQEHVDLLESVERARNEVLAEYREAIISFKDTMTNTEGETRRNGRDIYNSFDELMRDIVQDSGVLDEIHEPVPAQPTEPENVFASWFESENDNEPVADAFMFMDRNVELDPNRPPVDSYVPETSETPSETIEERNARILTGEATSSNEGIQITLNFAELVVNEPTDPTAPTEPTVDNQQESASEESAQQQAANPADASANNENVDVTENIEEFTTPPRPPTRRGTRAPTTRRASNTAKPRAPRTRKSTRSEVVEASS